MNKTIFYFSLFLISIYGIYLRFYELGSGSFWIDEGYSSIVSYFMYLQNFVPKMPSEWYEFSQYFFSFFQSLSFYFQVNDFYARIPSFIFGVLNIFVFYFFAKEIFSEHKYKNSGVFFLMFLFLFSTWQIIWSREARFYEMLSFLYLGNSFFLYKYFKDFKNIFFVCFVITSLIGFIFHPFFLVFFIIGVLLFGYKSFKEKKYKDIFIIIFIFLFYLIFSILVKYFATGSLLISNIIPKLNILGEFNFLDYFLFYLKTIYKELGIIFIFYILGSGYLVYKNKMKEFIIFFLLIFINIIVISAGYMAHSRYMFHLFSIITIFGGYNIIIFISYLGEKTKHKKVLFLILIIFFSILLYKTYNFTFLPQRFYYIDQTSPKPNFKLAYNYLQKNYNDAEIISGFPHMCYWYNLDNPKKCIYGLKVNLIGNEKLSKNFLKQKTDIYTNILYLDDFNNLDTKKYYFVLDDLTIKNAVNKEQINYIINNCNMFYKDVGNYESSNFIGIWKCQ